MPQQSDESLRAFLDRREKQLTEDIAARHSELAPMEAELAEVRRAKGALGIPQIVQMSARVAAVTSSRATLSITPDPRVPDSSRWQNDAHEAAAQIATDHHRQTAMTAAQEGADNFSGHGIVSPSPYEHLTMKQLIMKALTEHFQSGATAKQFREFFRDAWARDIDRASLSPQLSRLRGDKIIDRNGNVWFLIKKNEMPIGKQLL
jgi:hypothetical protein